MPDYGETRRGNLDNASIAGAPLQDCGGNRRGNLNNPKLSKTQPAVELPDVRLVIARCSVDYVGRLTAHLPSALRLFIVKADGSVLVHSDGGSYQSDC